MMSGSISQHGSSSPQEFLKKQHKNLGTRHEMFLVNYITPVKSTGLKAGI